MTKTLALTAVGLIATLVFLAVNAPRSSAGGGPDDRPAALKIDRTDQDGGAYYQPLALKNDTYRFFERGRRTMLDSTLAELDVDRDDGGHLARLGLIVRAEPQRFLPAPEGSQFAALPGSRSTAYSDIDGDSVFDVMVKVGPDLHQTSILVGDRWVRVNNQMNRFEVGSRTRAEDGTFYVFARGGWATAK